MSTTRPIIEAFAAIAEYFEQPVFAVSATGFIFAGNSEAARFLGISRRDLAGKELFQFLTDAEDRVREYLKSSSRTRQPTVGALTWRAHGDEVRTSCGAGLLAESTSESPAVLFMRCRAIEESTRQFLVLNEKIEALNRQIGIRRQVQEQLHAQREWFRTTLASIGDAVIATDEEGRVSFMNSVAEAMTGWPMKEAGGLPLERVFAIVNEQTRSAIESPVYTVLRTGSGTGLSNHTALLSRDGTERLIDDSASPIRSSDGQILGVVLVFRDVTEQRRADEKLRHAQKLESLGVLAGGIAHDFNNLLTGIVGNASLAREVLSQENEARSLIEDVLAAGERASHLTRQLLAYAGKGRFVIERVDLSAAVAEITALLQASIPKKVRLVLNLDRDLPPVHGDIGQLQQLVMNLVLNGAEAVPEGETGQVEVTTGVQHMDAGQLRDCYAADHAKPGKFITLKVCDTGSGMDEATKAKIFDPFFTTKFTGRGLGLSAALGIVRGHEGALSLETGPGVGTTFTVFLPAEAAGVAEAESRESVPVGAVSGKSSTVLVVDDEPVVRRAASNALQRANYTVLFAENGEAAVEIVSRDPEVDLVLLDLTMPVMDGEEALRRIRELRPELPVVLSSGFSEEEATSRFGSSGLAGFIQKPYTSARLVRTVKECINFRRSGTALT